MRTIENMWEKLSTAVVKRSCLGDPASLAYGHFWIAIIKTA
jgi:hypothetical protein